MKVKTIFLGSGEFAVPILKRLLELEYIQLDAVITQPDKPVGRKQILTPTPVGQFIEKEINEGRANVDVLKPEKLRTESHEILKRYEPELVLVASYGQIISSDFLNYPKYKALNFHGSLLPKLRGAVPVPIAILQGFKETGVTLQVMAEKMDEGPIVATKTIEVAEKETAESLMERLANLAVEIMDESLIKWIQGEIQPIEQNHSEATYCYKTDISKEKAEITKDTDCEVADRMVRAFYPWPVAWFRLRNGKILKIYKAEIADFENIPEIENKDSDILRVRNELHLRLNNCFLKLIEVQLEGKNRGEAKDYLYLSNLS